MDNSHVFSTEQTETSPIQQQYFTLSSRSLSKLIFLHASNALRWLHCRSCVSPTLPSPSSAPSITNFQRCAGKWPPCFCWCHSESRHSGVRVRGARRLRLNLRGCACSKGDSSLLIVCFNQALSQGSGSCRTSGSCHLYRDTQRKWEHCPRGNANPCAPKLHCAWPHVIIVNFKNVKRETEVSPLSLSICDRQGSEVNELLNRLWGTGTSTVMHAVPFNPRDKQSPGLAWQKSTVTSTSPVKTGFSLIADTAAAGNF